MKGMIRVEKSEQRKRERKRKKRREKTGATSTAVMTFWGVIVVEVSRGLVVLVLIICLQLLSVKGFLTGGSVDVFDTGD